VKSSRQGGKAKRKEPKDKGPQAPPTPKAPNLTPLCALCKFFGHATNNCPELPQLKPLVHDAFPESNIPEVHVNILVPPKKLKTLRKNHPCALCYIHGHYSQWFPHLDEIRDCLGEIREYEATRSKASTPLPMDSGTTSKPK